MYQEFIHKADLGNGTYLNPILDGDYADPAVCRFGEDYYLCVSTGPYKPGLSVFHSKDLVNWRFVCHPLRDFPYDVWAPDIFKLDGQFYIYFSARGTNYVIRSEKIEEGWSEAVDLKVGGIDPGHCVDENGNRYLFLSLNCIVPLAPDGLSVCGEPVQVLEPAPIPDEFDVTGCFAEAPNVFKKDGYYYLTYADGGSFGPATAHMIVSARAKNLCGPWEYSPYNPVVHTASRKEKWRTKGHGHFVEDTEGKWWVIYHAYENGYLTHGRKLLLSPVEFTEDGWFRVTAPADQPTPKPAGASLADDSSIAGDFTADVQNSGWMGFKENDFSRYEKTASGLRVRASGVRPGEAHPLTINTGDHSYEMTVHVRIEEGCEAGLILLYDEGHFSALSLSSDGLRLYRMGHLLRKFPLDSAPDGDLNGDSCYIKMRNDDQYLTFFYSTDGQEYKKINYVFDIESQNTNAFGGFLSQRPGIFAAVQAAGQGHAVFDGLTYTGKA